MPFKRCDEISILIEEGTITLGMTRQQLFTVLGDADEEGGTSRKYRIPCVFKYGDVEFVFPQAKTTTESQTQGLKTVYVDDGVDGLDEPRYLLSGDRNDYR